MNRRVLREVAREVDEEKLNFGSQIKAIKTYRVCSAARRGDPLRSRRRASRVGWQYRLRFSVAEYRIE